MDRKSFDGVTESPSKIEAFPDLGVTSSISESIKLKPESDKLKLEDEVKMLETNLESYQVEYKEIDESI